CRSGSRSSEGRSANPSCWPWGMRSNRLRRCGAIRGTRPPCRGNGCGSVAEVTARWTRARRMTMDATRGRLRTTARRSRVLWAAAPIAGALIALAGFLVAPLAAQEEAGPNVGHLSGVVVDAVSGVPLEGALVILDDEDRATLTDSAG